MVAIAVLATLTAVAVNQLLRARMVTNEQLAIVSTRLLARSCQFFLLARQAYPNSLVDLGIPTSNPPYISDPALLSGSKLGYRFLYTPGPGQAPSTFTLSANPEVHGTTGERHFFVDESLVLHATRENRDATAADPPLP
jgi:type II secretory pathway pseudopilin PulG